MRCPRCGFEGDFENGICPNCKCQIINNPHDSEIIEVLETNLTPQQEINSVTLSETNKVNQSEVDSMGQSSLEASTISSSSEQTTEGSGEFEHGNASASLPSDTSITPINSVPDAPLNEKTEVVSEKKDFSKVYYIILVLAVIVFLVLMGFIIKKNLKKDAPLVPITSTSTTRKVVETIMTKNKGIYTNISAPTNIGDITYGGILDKKNNKTVNADVEILRHLSQTEIDNVLAAYDYILNPGFKLDGVEYRVTLNDFDYLGGESINPTMKVHLFDTYYKNNFFLVNENYYTVSPINGNATEIRNGESANLMVVYQVPIDQNYYICFGEDFSNLGCFINSGN